MIIEEPPSDWIGEPWFTPSIVYLWLYIKSLGNRVLYIPNINMEKEWKLIRLRDKEQIFVCHKEIVNYKSQLWSTACPDKTQRVLRFRGSGK